LLVICEFVEGFELGKAIRLVGVERLVMPIGLVEAPDVRGTVKEIWPDELVKSGSGTPTQKTVVTSEKGVLVNDEEGEEVRVVKTVQTDEPLVTGTGRTNKADVTGE